MSQKTNAEMLVETLADFRNEESDTQKARLRLQLLDRVKKYVSEFRPESTDQSTSLEMKPAPQADGKQDPAADRDE